MMNRDACLSGTGTDPSIAIVGELLALDGMVPVVTLPQGYGLLPLTLSIAQVASWIGLKRTKIQQLINDGVISTAKVDGRTLVLTSSILALVERNVVVKAD